MRKTRDGHKRQNQYDLEKLKVGKLTVLTFFPSEIFVWNPHPLKEGHKLGKCGIDSFSREKVSDLGWEDRFGHKKGFEDFRMSRKFSNLEVPKQLITITQSHEQNYKNSIGDPQLE